MNIEKNIVQEIEVMVALLDDIPARNGLEEISNFLDFSFIDTKFSEEHSKKTYKKYNFSNLYKPEISGIYQKGNTYTFRIRTLDEEIAKHFVKTLQMQRYKKIQGLLARFWEVTQFPIERLYSITPAIVKNNTGYWKNGALSIDEYIERLKNNAWKKYHYFTGVKPDETQELFTRIDFTNNQPVPVCYKNITLLGDKITLQIATNNQAQEIAYMLLATGILEGGSRGLGYCNPKWLK